MKSLSLSMCAPCSQAIRKTKGSFTNYVDKTRQVGGPGQDMSTICRFSYNSKGIPSQMSIRVRWSRMGKIWSTQFLNDPLKPSSEKRTGHRMGHGDILVRGELYLENFCHQIKLLETTMCTMLKPQMLLLRSVLPQFY